MRPLQSGVGPGGEPLDFKGAEESNSQRARLPYRAVG